MKKSNVLGFLFLLLIGVLLGGWLTYKFKPLPDGKVLVNQSALDSLNAYIAFDDSIKNLPTEPVVVETDTVYIDSIVYITTTPVVESVTSTISRVRDSLVIDKEINAWVDIMIQGYVEDLEIDWSYRPIVRSIETITEISVFKPIITTIKEPKYITGHYLSAVAGGNDKFFTFGVDYDLVRYNRIYGFQYRRQGDMNVYGVKLGINLTTLFKKTR